MGRKSWLGSDHRWSRIARVCCQSFTEITAKPDGSITSDDVKRLFEIIDKVRDAEFNGRRVEGIDFRKLTDTALPIRQAVGRRDADAAKQQRKALQQQQLAEQRAAAAEEAENLIKNYGNLGPPPSFLKSLFSTASDPDALIGTVIGFYGRIPGKTSWQLDQGAWVITQLNRAPGSDTIHKITYVFVNENQPNPILTAMYLDGSRVAEGALIYLVDGINKQKLVNGGN
jgi:hypothetical protein